MAVNRFHLFVLIAGIAVLLGCSDRTQDWPQPRRIVDLSPPLTSDINLERLGSRAMDFLGTDGRTSFEPIVPPRSELAFGLDRICLLSHTGSHIDAPARLLRGGERPGQISLDRLAGPAKVADLRWHDRTSPLQITDLEQTPIDSGDIVILYVGYTPPSGSDQWPQYASLSTQASEWLVAKRIRALATDMPALVSFEALSERLLSGQPPEKAWSEYVPLFQGQIPVIAGLTNLEAIAKETRVTFLAFPLPLSEGSGSPLRAAALVY